MNDNVKLKSKYDFNENVLINTNNKNNLYLNGKKGCVLGKSVDENNNWKYGVMIFDLEEVWSFSEEDLQSEYTFSEDGFHRSGDIIKVIVNNKGEGEIKN